MEKFKAIADLLPCTIITKISPKILQFASDPNDIGSTFKEKLKILKAEAIMQAKANLIAVQTTSVTDE
jgi:hypothetical protein